MPKAAKLIIEVQAGIIPGTPIDTYSKRWVLSFEEVQDTDALIAAQGAAMNYALIIQNPSNVNWVRLDWVWL